MRRATRFWTRVVGHLISGLLWCVSLVKHRLHCWTRIIGHLISRLLWYAITQYRYQAEVAEWRGETAHPKLSRLFQSQEYSRRLLNNVQKQLTLCPGCFQARSIPVVTSQTLQKIQTCTKAQKWLEVLVLWKEMLSREIQAHVHVLFLCVYTLSIIRGRSSKF